MTYILLTQEYASSQEEKREVDNLSFCLNIGKNGGFYKVQIIDAERGTILYEFKNEPNDCALTYARAAFKEMETQKEAELYKHVKVECLNKNDEPVSLEFFVFMNKSGRFGWNTKPEHVMNGCTVYGKPYSVSLAGKFLNLEACLNDIADYLAYRHDVKRTVSSSFLGTI